MKDRPIAVPQATSGHSLPAGLQLIGREFDEAALLQLGHIIEQTLDVQRPTMKLETS